MANVDPEVRAASSEMAESPDDGEGVTGTGCPSPANIAARKKDNTNRTEQETESFTEGSPFTGWQTLRFAQDVALRAGGTIAPSESLDLA